MLNVGIMGATGYMGGEALRVLLDHPQAEIAWLTSRSPGAIEDHHPNLYGLGLELIHPDDIAPCDVAFLALPTEASMNAAARLIAMGCKVIDLGSAFRLREREVWESVYGVRHTQWSLAQQAVYGVTELHQDEVRQTPMVANPGCFASAAILGLAPLLKYGLVDEQTLVVSGLSGTAGAGAELSRAAHHPEIGNNLVAYNVVDHRHSYEMEQELSLLAGQSVSVHFTPVYAPIVRGILDICYAFPKHRLTRQSLLEMYQTFYQDHEFVKIYDHPKEQNVSWQYKPYPWVNSVAGSNYCYIGLDVDEKRNRIVIFSVLDSLGKGGAQVGVENMNLMFGLERTTGLLRRGMHPL
jgi:N-acetyl-gamma-glutamyl-phosphate reductase common form